MSKFTTLFLIALLLCSTLTYAARPEPSFNNDSPSKTQHKEVETEQSQSGVAEESCEGVGEEECLMRRTLAAHTDYIYTQNQNP